MSTPDYVHTVARAIPDAEDCWAWNDTRPDLPDATIEASSAAIAVAVWLDQAEPGTQGAITLPDGQMVTWHEADGWSVWSEYGVSSPLGVAVDAAPARVAAAVRRI